MKRFQSCAVLLLALLLLALAGCSGGEKQVDAAALADELKNGLTFKDEMMRRRTRSETRCTP